MSKFVKICLFFSFFFSLIALTPLKTYAIYDPTSVPNNSFGIHIANIQDLEDAAKLVNSEGGDWGYVTLVITEDNRTINVWQEVFNKMRRLHLIPIVRVATKEENGNWKKPVIGEIDSWISFFNSLNWVIKNRYVVIGNEINLGKEWGGEVNPEAYATYVKEFTNKLKSSSSDYFVMPAGFDASLPTAKGSLEESSYLRRMLIKEPDIFELVDGWASHSYPNPNFSGSEYATGRGTIKTFEWEMSYLKSLGVKKDFPIFITETGWAHKVSGNKNTSKFLNESQLSPKFERGFKETWNTKNIVAVTPFILNYEYPPFDMFSWKNNGSFNSLYENMQKLIKIAGCPIQEDKADIPRIFVPAINLLGIEFTGLFFVENKGQTIWSKDNLKVVDENGSGLEIDKISLSSYEPGGSGFIVFKGKFPTEEGTHQKSIQLLNSETIISPAISFRVLSMATLRMKLERFLDSVLLLWHPER
ncbi:MAG: hypothetical protein NTV24_03210 [Candidatus Woesebacteria bacterium]|nr:hypothetical protein [Candidatus Woesebacteria bacterium]